MSPDWYCTSKAIAQIMIAFMISIYDDLKTQTLHFIKVFQQSCSGAIIVHDKTLACALDKVVTFAGEVWFGRNPPFDLRISGRTRRTSYSERETCTSLFLISSLMKQVLKSPNKSTVIIGLIKSCSQKNAEKLLTALYHTGCPLALILWALPPKLEMGLCGAHYLYRKWTFLAGPIQKNLTSTKLVRYLVFATLLESKKHGNLKLQKNTQWIDHKLSRF